MGAGKTSVGRALAGQLGWPFEDLDDRVEKLQGSAVAEIFQRYGEEHFRQAEHNALKQALEEMQNQERVLALGGGAFARAENQRVLASAGVSTVFLDAPVAELFERCRQQQVERPLLKSFEQFERLYEQRRDHYSRALFRVETADKDVKTVALEVAWVSGAVPAK
jgi:shikimate kinase